MSLAFVAGDSVYGDDRHMTLAMWAQAFLAVVRAERGVPVAPKKGRLIRTGPRSLAGFKAHRGLPSA